MKRLVDLDPHWFHRNGRPEGIRFHCPICRGGEGEGHERHSLVITWEPPSIHTSGAVWTKTGNTFDNLTVTPSIDATRGGHCKFHGFITQGVVTWS